MQIPRFRCKMTLHLIPEPEEKALELLRDLTANDNMTDDIFLARIPRAQTPGRPNASLSVVEG
jgi:hypothetical protein